MTGELKPSRKHVIGDAVYRKWRHPGADPKVDTDAYWYDAYSVIKVTEKQVHVQNFSESTYIILKRRSLERSGFAVSMAHRAVFYAELPDDYRKRTIGYLMDREPRNILGLSDRFTAEELKNAYRDRARATHPDRGGDPREFMAVQAAYERLSEPHTLGAILSWLDENPKEGDSTP